MTKIAIKGYLKGIGRVLRVDNEAFFVLQKSDGHFTYSCFFKKYAAAVAAAQADTPPSRVTGGERPFLSRVVPYRTLYCSQRPRFALRQVNQGKGGRSANHV
jgi:hypothetical protein